MYKEIEFGNKKIAFLSNGATPIFFKQTFRTDLLKELSGDEMEIASENIPKLGFIMAMQANKADMMKLNFEMYIDWLTQFEALELSLNSDAIAAVYIADSIPDEEPKKKAKGGRKG